MFDKNAVKEIIEATGAPLKNADADALAYDIQDAVDAYDIWRIALKTPPTEKQRRETFEVITKRAELLLKAMGVGHEDDIQQKSPHLCTALTRQARLYAESIGGFPGLQKTPFFSESGESGEKIMIMDYQESTAIRRAIEGVQRLAIWAGAGIEEMNSPDWEQWDSGAGPSAELWLIGNGLPNIYDKHADKPFGTSNPSNGKGEAYGPGIRFIQTCLKKIGMSKPPDAIARQYRRYLKQWDNEV